MFLAVATARFRWKGIIKSFDMEFSHLVVGCAAVLRGAEPISLSNGLYQPACTRIYNPETQKPPKKCQSAMSTI